MVTAIAILTWLLYTITRRVFLLADELNAHGIKIPKDKGWDKKDTIVTLITLLGAYYFGGL